MIPKTLSAIKSGRVVAVLAALALASTFVSCRDNTEDARPQEESVFRPGLDPGIDLAVRELRANTRVPIDHATRNKADALISELAKSFETVDVEGGKIGVNVKASHDLRRIGQPVIPQLIDAAATLETPSGRQHALATVFHIVKDGRGQLIDFLPLFVRSMSDTSAEVTGTAVALIGRMTVDFHYHKQHNELQQSVQHLIRAMNEHDDDGVRACAARFLYRIGKGDIIPQELMDKYQITITSH